MYILMKWVKFSKVLILHTLSKEDHLYPSLDNLFVILYYTM